MPRRPTRRQGVQAERQLIAWLLSTDQGRRFAFVYNGDRISEVGRPSPIDVSGGLFARHPYQASFRCGRFDFTLITCHLTYGKTQADHNRRAAECDAVAEYARSLAAREREKD